MKINSKAFSHRVFFSFRFPGFALSIGMSTAATNAGAASGTLATSTLGALGSTTVSSRILCCLSKSVDIEQAFRSRHRC